MTVIVQDQRKEGGAQTYVDVCKLVNVLDDSLDATKEALESRNQTNQEAVFGVGFLGEFQQEVQELNKCQHQGSKCLNRQ